MEGRDAPLYHHMEHDKAVIVFEADTLEPWWTHDVPGLGILKGTSMTRNASMTMRRPVTLVIDQRRISQTNRIVPLDGELVFAHTLGYRKMHDRRRHYVEPKDKAMFTLAEEFVVGVVKPLHVAVVRIVLHADTFLSGAQSWAVYEAARAYSKKWNVPIVGGKPFVDRERERRAVWREDD